MLNEDIPISTIINPFEIQGLEFLDIIKNLASQFHKLGERKGAYFFKGFTFGSQQDKKSTNEGFIWVIQQEIQRSFGLRL